MHNSTSRIILLVDDDPLIRRITSMVLQKFGYQVLEADCGPNGLECFLCHKGHVDLVVSDVLMPRMSGPEMIREILLIDPSARVMFLTGYAADETLHDIGRPGIAVLPKPFTFDRLLETVAQCLAA